MKFMRLLCVCIGLLCIAPSLLAWGNFRFAHLTDLHISGEPTKQYLDQSINQINADPSIAFVLITGDLTDSGDNTSLEWFYRQLKKFNKPYYVLCGNHETTWTESGLETFNRLFESDRMELEYQGVLFLGFNTGPYVRMAYGHVAPQDLKWVGQKVREHGADKKLFLVTHYPLMEGDVDNWYEATDSLRQYSPVAMIGGHYHVNRFLSYDGIPGILGRSNLKDKEGLVGYTEYQITQDSMLVFEHAIGQAPRQWAAVSMTNLPYDPKGHADKYPNFDVNRYFPQVEEVWHKNTGVSIYSTAATDGKAVYVGNNEGILTKYAISNGQELWKVRLGGKIVGSPAFARNMVVVGSTDHNIYGVDAQLGTIKWKVQTAEAQMGSVRIGGKVAYIAGSDHKMRALDLQTGREVWTFDGVKGYVVTLPLLQDGKVIFGAWDNTLYALNQKTGALEWKWRSPRGMHYSPAGVWPVSDGKAVYVVDPERALTAVDLKTGSQLWRTKEWKDRQSKVRESLGISQDRKRLYAKTMQDYIVCYEANPQKPVPLWECDAVMGYEHATTMHPEKDGIVYSSTKDGLVIAIEGKTGRLLWEHKVGNSFVNTVTPLGKGLVLMTETSGEVVLLRAK